MKGSYYLLGMQIWHQELECPIGISPQPNDLGWGNTQRIYPKTNTTQYTLPLCISWQCRIFKWEKGRGEEEKERDGLVSTKEKRSRVETRMDRPNPRLCFFSTTSISHHFWYCHCLALVFSVQHRLWSSNEQKFSAGSFLVAHLGHFLLVFIFDWWTDQLPISPTGNRVNSTRCLSMDHCHFGPSHSDFALLPTLIPLKGILHRK